MWGEGGLGGGLLAPRGVAWLGGAGRTRPRRRWQRAGGAFRGEVALYGVKRGGEADGALS